MLVVESLEVLTPTQRTRGSQLRRRAQQELQLVTLAGGEIGPVLQPQPPSVLQLRTGGDLVPAYRIDGLGQLRRQVKPVERQPSIRQMLRDPGDEGRAHVRAGRVHPLRVTTMRDQVRREPLHRAAVAALGRDSTRPASRSANKLM
jgi:hypothetical protein